MLCCMKMNSNVIKDKSKAFAIRNKVNAPFSIIPNF